MNGIGTRSVATGDNSRRRNMTNCAVECLNGCRSAHGVLQQSAWDVTTDMTSKGKKAPAVKPLDRPAIESSLTKLAFVGDCGRVRELLDPPEGKTTADVAEKDMCVCRDQPCRLLLTSLSLFTHARWSVHVCMCAPSTSRGVFVCAAGTWVANGARSQQRCSCCQQQQQPHPGTHRTPALQHAVLTRAAQCGFHVAAGVRLGTDGCTFVCLGVPSFVGRLHPTASAAPR